jgi:hypothetical protein
MGDPLAAVGLPTPDVEHVSVRRLGWPEIAHGNDVDSSAARVSEPHDLLTPATRSRSRPRDAPVMHVMLLGYGKAPQNGAFL